MLTHAFRNDLTGLATDARTIDTIARLETIPRQQKVVNMKNTYSFRKAFTGFLDAA
jgi:hypothetical protein